MPVLQVYLDTSQHEEGDLNRFLKKASAAFASRLSCPEDRIRVYIHHTARALCSIGGSTDPDTAQAPFFQFYLLAGRPPEQKIALLQDFTSLLASELGAPTELIRGFCTHVPPQDWGIAGVPAALEREDEIAAREIGQ